ncbi:adenylate/guanylate cyclase domain-containing protein [Methylobacterium sp. J-030]|uniref:CHASE2 domain-containing protein n=1 Tax=Methylobacterium sp. J-030 TaxID=2836627 RepID=UPI001FBB68BE|nr:adenylate/guanylate cyclase domain-containing protein [Methylobacterium sp. J-030]MCJ2074045.1 adenylate/guanylate cyclase domain-containing protein [Methylobacterium sp. J-030]
MTFPRVRRLGLRIGPGRALAALVLVALLTVRVYDPPPVEALRLRVFDAYQVVAPRVPPPERPVAIVDIDEASLAVFGQWPWSRTRLAEICEKLGEGGAAIVAFDVIFSEPDRLSPPLLATTLPFLNEAARANLRAQPDSDRLFAQAIKTLPVVLGQTASAAPVPWTGAAPPPQTGIAVVGTDLDPTTALIDFPGLIRNLPILEQAAAGRGVFTISPERDGVVRRVPMVLRAAGAVVPALSLDVLRVLTRADSILVRTDQQGVVAIRLPDFVLPTDPRGQIWVRFSPHDPGLYVSAQDLLAGRVSPDRLKDRIVLVGTSAVGLLDNRTTPIDRAMPGVEIHAQLLETLLTGTNLTLPNDAVMIELGVAAAVSVGIIVLAPILGAFTLLILGGFVAAGLACVSWYRFTAQGVLFDATFPLATTFLVYLVLVFTNYFREQAGRSRIRAAFGRYLSPALVEQLAQSPAKLRLGGEARRLTIMFSDVRGFTTIAEFYKTDPTGLTALMNRFLTPLTDAILERKGTIDKYMGDAIMAFWNAPLDDAAQETNAAAAALDMLARMDALNETRRIEAEAGGYPVLPLNVGIGINTGSCVVGNMGSNLRFDYSVLGDAVNLASRLEGQSKYYGVKIILGAETADAIRDRFAVLEIDLIQVKGKQTPERISTLVGDRDVAASALFVALAAQHGAMIAAYRARRWEEARANAEACRALGDGLRLDGLYRLYRERAEAFMRDPPPDAWSGVHVATSK